jgi:hypothetical protein
VPVLEVAGEPVLADDCEETEDDSDALTEVEALPEVVEDPRNMVCKLYNYLVFSKDNRRKKRKRVLSEIFKRGRT